MIEHKALLKRKLFLATALMSACAALGACSHASPDNFATGAIPSDYRLRHPIVVQEADRTTEIFVGSGRGGLTAAQRADIIGLGQTWGREGTGGIVIDMPANTPNARVAGDSLREIQSLLVATGVPPRGITVRKYTPADPRQFATIRVKYPRIIADAGPCGIWPEDLGPTATSKIAAMVDNPADLVQPRAETPAYTSRRNVAFNKYRKGDPTTTTYPESDKAKLSELGK
jgi:pilus assembly protein CpaD